MRKKQLISLEKLEYDVYKNENDTKIQKLITLDDFFKISISRVPPARANQQPNSQTTI